MAEENDTDQSESPTEAEQQKMAIETLLGAFEQLIAGGVDRERLVIVALSATLNQMVAVFGEEKTAAIMETVPEKLRSGHFTSKPEGIVQ